MTCTGSQIDDKEALRSLRDLGDLTAEAYVLASLAKTCINHGGLDRAQASLEEAGRKGEALQERAFSAATRTAPALVATLTRSSGAIAEVTNPKTGDAEVRVERLHWLRSYITDAWGRKFY